MILSLEQHRTSIPKLRAQSHSSRKPRSSRASKAPTRSPAKDNHPTKTNVLPPKSVPRCLSNRARLVRGPPGPPRQAAVPRPTGMKSCATPPPSELSSRTLSTESTTLLPPRRVARARPRHPRKARVPTGLGERQVGYIQSARTCHVTRLRFSHSGTTAQQSTAYHAYAMRIRIRP